MKHPQRGVIPIRGLSGVLTQNLQGLHCLLTFGGFFTSFFYLLKMLPGYQGFSILFYSSSASSSLLFATTMGPPLQVQGVTSVC